MDGMIKYAALMLVPLLAWRCGDKEEHAVEPAIAIHATSLSLPSHAGAQQTIDFTSTVSWTVALTDAKASEWCLVTPTSGPAGDAKLTVSATQENPTYDNRETRIVITAGTVTKPVTVTQKKKDALVLTQNRYDVPYTGETIDVELQSNVEYEVKIPETAKGWVSQIGAKGLTTSRLQFRIEPNDGEVLREAVVVFKDRSSALSDEVTISQVAAPQLKVPQTVAVDGGAGQKAITLVSTEDWTISPEASNPAGCTVSPMSGKAGKTELTVSVEKNPEYDGRSWKYRVTAGTMSAPMEVVQAKEGALILSPSEVDVPAAGQTIDVQLQKNVEYTLDIPADASAWIKQLPDSKGLETETLRFEVAVNTGYAERKGVITLRDKNSPLSSAIAVVQRSKYVPTVTDGWDIYEGGQYRYGPSIIVNGDGSVDAWFAAPGGRYGNNVDLFRDQGQNAPVSLGGGSTSVGQKFSATQPFYSAGAVCVNWSGQPCELRLSLYRWNNSYAATVGSAPLARKTFRNYEDGSFVQVSTGEMLAAGTYLWVMDQGGTDQSGLWKHPGVVSGVTNFMNGQEVNYSFSGAYGLVKSEGGVFWDQASYQRTTNGGRNWTAEKMVLLPTEFSSDHFSVCDPGVARWGGYYYIGYTSTENKDMVENHVYVARGLNPDGPWEKWNGKGWTTGADVQPMIRYDGNPVNFGAGEPSIVVLNGKIYFYYSWNDTGTTTRLVTADAADPLWPARLTFHGTVMDKKDGGSDHSDVKYREDIGKFQAIHTAGRMGPSSYIVVWQSDNGIKFDKIAELREGLQPYLHNCGWSGDEQGHMKAGTQQYISYAYGSATAAWGVWKTRWSMLNF